jgi:hypothetical protein
VALFVGTADGDKLLELWETRDLRHGGEVQEEPMKPTMKAPETECLNGAG